MFHGTVHFYYIPSQDIHGYLTRRCNNSFKYVDLMIKTIASTTKDKTQENHRFPSLKTQYGEEILGRAPNATEWTYFWKRVNGTSTAEMVNRFNFRNLKLGHHPCHNDEGMLIKGKVFFVVVWVLVCSLSSLIKT